LRSRFASSGRHPSREIVCVKRRCSGIRCSIRSRIGGSATGVLITDNCHDTVRRWEQCAPGTSAAPEQKVNRKAGGRGRPTPDLAALTFTAGPTDWIEPGGYARLPPLRIFTRGDFRFCFAVNGHCAPGSLPLSCCPADDLPRRPAPAQRLGMCRQAMVSELCGPHSEILAFATEASIGPDSDPLSLLRLRECQLRVVRSRPGLDVWRKSGHRAR